MQARLNVTRLTKRVSTSSTGCLFAPSSAPPAVPDDSTISPHDEDSLEEHESSDGESDFEDFTEEKAQKIFNDSVITLPRDIHHVMAVVLMESLKKQQKMQVVDAAREAALITGYNERIVQKHCKEFFSNKGEPEESKRGK